MSVVIEMRFVGGRYHATPWGHHVNEGLVEWPPSPWRLSRALAAVWYAKLREEIDEERMCTLVDKLASDLPKMRLPKSTRAHTRQYVPLGTIDKGKEKTTLIFDAFLQVDKDTPLHFVWPSLSLDDGERTVLAQLLEVMPYLGRAESWVQAELLPADSALGEGELSWVVPKLEPKDPPGFEVVRLLVPLTTKELQESEEATLQTLRAQLLAEKQQKENKRAKKRDAAPKETKLSKKEIEAASALIPASTWEALKVQTSVLQKAGYSGVPGTKWVEYCRPRALWKSPGPSLRKRSRVAPTVARFELTSTVAPRLTSSLLVGHVLRRALLKLSDGAQCFVGRDDNNAPLTGAHRHGFYLAESLPKVGQAERGTITHLTVVAAGGFDRNAWRALERLRTLHGVGDERHELKLSLLGMGQPRDFEMSLTQGVSEGRSPLFARSRDWVSRTAFVSTTHLKEKCNAFGERKGSSADNLRRLFALALAERELEEVEVVSLRPVEGTDLGGHLTRWHHFSTRQRGRKGVRGNSPPAGFVIELSEAVSGPFALGFGAHFGLGQFVPALGR